MIASKTPVPDLPQGWFKCELVRKSGLSAGRCEVYYISPDGQTVKSKAQLLKIVGSHADLTAFDFKTGKMSSHILRQRNRKMRASDFTKDGLISGAKFDMNLSFPVRQTASIFKQPVTIIKGAYGSDVKQDFKVTENGSDKSASVKKIYQPRQLFWEKRLQGIRACDIDSEELVASMPPLLKPIGPTCPSSDISVQSITAALYQGSKMIKGQSASKSQLMKNPCIYINPEQPLIEAVSINDDTIASHESRIRELRRELQMLLESEAESGTPPTPGSPSSPASPRVKMEDEEQME